VSGFDGPAVLEVLHRHGVDFVLIGGFAAVVHGSPLLTTDVDITPEQGRDNLARLSAALTELDARGRAEGAEPLPFSHDADSLARAGVWDLTTKHGDLDISFVPAGTRGYPDLARDAVEVELRGIPVKLASLADIVRSKDAAARPKDLRALPVLRELLARETRQRAARGEDRGGSAR
jgi:hypothetical protein